jgi:metal-sulfur cluster biosynthetic enzyme
VLIYLLLIVPFVIIAGIVVAVRRQSNMTPSYSKQVQEEDARVFAESTKALEATVAEALAEKARDPRLASMSQEDLVYEVLKECYDPEIPLNVVDLGLIYEVKTGPDEVNVKMKLEIAGFPNPKVQIVMEPPWSPQRISEAGRKSLGI